MDRPSFFAPLRNGGRTSGTDRISSRYNGGNSPLSLAVFDGFQVLHNQVRNSLGGFVDRPGGAAFGNHPHTRSIEQSLRSFGTARLHFETCVKSSSRGIVISLPGRGDRSSLGPSFLKVYSDYRPV